MIPKVIHYCWFGRNPLPESAKRCIESWKKYCPDYKIIQWNEDNYDCMKQAYMRDAYLAKKWAFVSDYARVDIIYEHGGIYLDTDVELIKPLDKFLNDKLFCGWEGRDQVYIDKNPNYENSVNFGLGYGAEKGHPILKSIMNLYDTLSFYNKDGSMNLMSCPHYQTLVLKEFGISDNDRVYQKLDNVVVYSEDYFSPKSITTGKILLTKNTVSIHHFSMSWIDPIDRRFQNLSWKLGKFIGYKLSDRIISFTLLPYRGIRKIRRNFEK